MSAGDGAGLLAEDQIVERKRRDRQAVGRKELGCKLEKVYLRRELEVMDELEI